MDEALDVVRVLCKHIKMSNKTRDAIKKFADAAEAMAELSSDEEEGANVDAGQQQQNKESTFKKPRQDCVTR